MTQHRFKLLHFTVIASLVMMMACSGDDHSRVRRAAEQCYEYLQDGQYEKFVGQIAYADSMSDNYRAQMVDLVKEFAAAEQQRHGKLQMVRITGDTIIGEQAHVYLQVTYADSTSEEVGLPMVKVGKKWLMQ